MQYDYFGNELEVGTEVVFMEINYRNLTRGIIVKLNPKKAAIKWLNLHGYHGKTTQFYDQLIKVPSDKLELIISEEGNVSKKPKEEDKQQ